MACDTVRAARGANEKPPHRGALSRRTLFQRVAGMALISAALPLWGGEMAKAQPKVSKTEAKYQDQPKDGHSCAMCQFFHPPKTCQQVDGDISPSGWCMLWQQKH